MSTISNNTDTWPQFSLEFQVEARALELFQRLQYLPVAARRRLLTSAQVWLDQFERNINEIAD